MNLVSINPDWDFAWPDAEQQKPADLKDPEGHRAEVITCITCYYINYSPYEVVVVVTWLTEVMAYDTSYQLSALRSFPVHLTSGDPNWSHWVVGQALTSGFIQVSVGYHDLDEWEPAHIK